MSTTNILSLLMQHTQEISKNHKQDNPQRKKSDQLPYKEIIFSPPKRDLKGNILVT